jgi:beta-lactam-binding protein with PASTA domain
MTLSSQTPPRTTNDPDAWPIADDATVVSRSDTRVGGPPPAAPPPPGPPADRRIGAGMLLGLGVLALVAAGILVAWLLTHRDSQNQTTTVIVTTGAGKGSLLPPKVSVPRLVGLKEQEALVRLGQLGLRPKEVFRPTKQPKGVVVAQKPQEATELPRGGRVTLVIDSGAPQVSVPDLTGGSFADAQRKLDQLGLDSTKTEVTSTEPAGTIVDQAPKAGGKLAKGSTVTLSVARSGQPTQTTQTNAATTNTPTTNATTNATTTSSATTPTTTAAATPPQPTSATMPDVSGQKEPAAVSALNQAGILASLVFVPADDPLGTVEQQAKPSGATLPYHAHVQLNISRGPNNNPLVSVPNVIGQPLDQAVGTLNAAHLRLIYVKLPVTSRTQVGKIVQQSPLGGGQAPQNAQVAVYLGVLRQ